MHRKDEDKDTCTSTTIRGRSKTWEREVPTGVLEISMQGIMPGVNIARGAARILRVGSESCDDRLSLISKSQSLGGGWSEMEVYSYPLTVVSRWCDGALVPTEMR
jgi:hypothetical protein